MFTSGMRFQRVTFGDERLFHGLVATVFKRDSLGNVDWGPAITHPSTASFLNALFLADPFFCRPFFLQTLVLNELAVCHAGEAGLASLSLLRWLSTKLKSRQHRLPAFQNGMNFRQRELHQRLADQVSP